MAILSHRYCCLILVSVLIAFDHNPAHCQYMYLDSSGDGYNSNVDRLNPTGEPTRIHVLLDTSHNKDSTTARCDAGQEPLTLNSYEVIIRAVNGSVIFGPYTNEQLGMSNNLGNLSSDSELYVGYAGASILDPGTYELGYLDVTVTYGSPTLQIVTNTSLSPVANTSFGTRCMGVDGDNTYKLGLDWHDVDGCGPPDSSNSMPAATVANEATVVAGTPIILVGEFADRDSTDSLSVGVDGVPTGLSLVHGAPYDGHRQLRLYGTTQPVSTEEQRDLVWSVTSSVDSEKVHTTLYIRPASTTQIELEKQINDVVTTDYEHGMPHLKARALGAPALPILAQMLRNPRYKGSWHRITQAIGDIGEPSYFDTLRAFVWQRFQGDIDVATFTALQTAQANLNAIASVSGPALEYLLSTATPGAWASVPWNYPPMGRTQVANLFATHTIMTLSRTDSERAHEYLLALPTPTDTYQAHVLSALRDFSENVRRRGLLMAWDK